MDSPLSFACSDIVRLHIVATIQSSTGIQVRKRIWIGLNRHAIRSMTRRPDDIRPDMRTHTQDTSAAHKGPGELPLIKDVLALMQQSPAHATVLRIHDK